MKNIIILGAPRVGKSSLSSLICKTFEDMHYVSGDSIRNAFTKIYPILNYTSENTIEKKDFCDFINFIISENVIHLKRQINYVIDTTDISLENAINTFKDSIIIVLGCKDISEIEYRDIMKQHNSELEWTNKYSDDKLLEVSEKTINMSNKLFNECSKYNIPYFETSINRDEVFKNILEYISLVH